MPELKRPPVPHASVTKRVLEKLRKMDAAQLRETFVRSGILTPDGKLTRPYGGDEDPVDSASAG